MDSFSTFFGLVLKPGFEYKTIVKEDLIVTRAVISPEAEPKQTARLLMRTDGRRVPLCHLDSTNVTTCPLHVYLFPGMECIFTVAGDCPIHITGFNKIRDPPFASSSLGNVSSN